MAKSSQAYISVVDFAEHMGLSTATVRKYVRGGDIPTVVLGRRFLIPSAFVVALDRVLANGRSPIAFPAACRKAKAVKP